MTGVMPAFGDGCGVGSGVEDIENAETRLRKQTFVFTGRAEKVITNGTSCGELFVRNDATDDECVAEEKTRGRFEDPGQFAKEAEAGRDVTENVV